MMPPSGYAQLSRKELQAVAKQRGVAANKTSAFLCDELTRLDAGRENLPAQNAATETTACNSIGSLARPPPKLPPKPPGAKLSERAPRRLHPSPPPPTEASTVAASTVATSTVATSTVAASTVAPERAPRWRNPAGDGEGRVDPAGEGEVAMNFLSVRRSSKTNTPRTAAVKAAGAAVPAKAAALAAPAAKAPAPTGRHAAAAAAEARQEAAAVAAALRLEASEVSPASTVATAKATAQVVQAAPKAAAPTAAAVRKEAAPTAPTAQRRKFSEAAKNLAADGGKFSPPQSALCAALEQLLCNHASLFRSAVAILLKVVANLRLHPDDEAYRGLRCSTKAFQSALEPTRGAVACLVALGFVYDAGDDDAGGRYALGDAADAGVLAEAEERLRALPQEYEQRAARQEEEAARSLDALRMVSKLNREKGGQDARVRQLVTSGLLLAPQLGSPTSPDIPARC